MDKFECAGCGAPLNPDNIKRGYVKCEYCGNVFKVEKEKLSDYLGNVFGMPITILQQYPYHDFRDWSLPNSDNSSYINEYKNINVTFTGYTQSDGKFPIFINPDESVRIEKPGLINWMGLSK